MASLINNDDVDYGNEDDDVSMLPMVMMVVVIMKTATMMMMTMVMMLKIMMMMMIMTTMIMLTLVVMMIRLGRVTTYLPHICLKTHKLCERETEIKR